MKTVFTSSLGGFHCKEKERNWDYQLERNMGLRKGFYLCMMGLENIFMLLEIVLLRGEKNLMMCERGNG